MEVEFKIVQSVSLEVSLDIVVNLIISRYNDGHRVGVLASESIAKKLDDLLWKDGEETFIPHFCATSISEYSSFKNIPILLTDNMFIMSGFKEIINVCDVPIDSSKIPAKNVIELVFQNDNALNISRKKYIYYKKAGNPISTNKS